MRTPIVKYRPGQSGRVLSNRKTPRGIWALRGVTIAVALLVILVVGTMIYSAYQEYNAIRPELSGGPNQPVGLITQNGNVAIVSLNFTIPNDGLYTINVTLTCDNSNPSVVCQEGHVTVPPGGEQVLRFKMTVTDVQRYVGSSDLRINGTLSLALEPFIGIAINTDLSSLASSLVNNQGA